ncbi:CBS domain-containing protein (plasmid) [Halorarum halophilum]|uniref:CBS domain-containing protein n=1 Tax=Halorarum halophilum TaxID=2743090 RepID=A0A7D5GZL3_9EURY|nr:CBS domain-containing protein [Halobaculum halophilum]QLG29649.1 CBS domain-containing protein [Halobaculum halophilum]
MDDIFVARLMSSDLRTVTPDTLVEEAAGTMLEHGIGSVIVVDDDGGLAGILTSTDFVRIVAERRPKDETPVSEYMTTDVVTATAQDVVTDVADAMLDHGVHHIPIVSDEDGVIGIVTTTDIAAYVSQTEAPSPA